MVCSRADPTPVSFFVFFFLPNAFLSNLEDDQGVPATVACSPPPQLLSKHFYCIPLLSLHGCAGISAAQVSQKV